jgi:hypothetical protein
MKAWFNSGANVRLSHNAMRPIGKGITCETDNTGATYVRSVIIDKQAKKLVRAGVLRAYSVGINSPRIERDVTGKALGGIITGGVITELTLCDRPSNPSCGVRIVKAASGELVTKSFGMKKYGKAERKLLKSAMKPPKKADTQKARLEMMLTSPDPFFRETARTLLGK